VIKEGSVIQLNFSSNKQKKRPQFEIAFRLLHSITCGYILISMSTPLGRSSRISASMVLLVGSWMSIRRLCVRSSKCSMDSLSM